MGPGRGDGGTPRPHQDDCIAVPDVLVSTDARLVAPVDWVATAPALAAGPLGCALAERIECPSEFVERSSTTATAQRLARAWGRLFA